MDNWVRIPIAAPRARRLTLPNFVEPRAGRCSCPGQSLLPFARSSLLRARIWEEPAPAQLERWWAASEQGDAASGAGGGQQNTCRLHCACRRSSQSEDRGSQCTSSSLLDCVHLESAHAQLRGALRGPFHLSSLGFLAARNEMNPGPPSPQATAPPTRVTGPHA